MVCDLCVVRRVVVSRQRSCAGDSVEVCEVLMLGVVLLQFQQAMKDTIVEAPAV